MATAVTNRRMYSVSELLELQSSASPLETLTVDMCEDIDPKSTMRLKEKSPADKNTVIKFRKDASPKEIKFIEDMDVPISQIVHAYNLGDAVTWPVLKTFCEKTVGVPALDIRMMRRKKPAEARLIFRTQDDANTFLANVPPAVALKGRTPKFEMETTAPKHSPKVDEMVVCTVVDAEKEVPKCGSPVLFSSPTATPVAVAQISEVDEADCCVKQSTKIETPAAVSEVVPTAVALDVKMGGKAARGGNRSSPASKSSKRSASGRAARAKTGTIVGISLDNLRRHSGVDLADDLFALDTNIQV